MSEKKMLRHCLPNPALAKEIKKALNKNYYEHFNMLSDEEQMELINVVLAYELPLKVIIETFKMYETLYKKENNEDIRKAVAYASIYYVNVLGYSW